MESNAIPTNGTVARLDELTRRANESDKRAEAQWRSIAHTDRNVAVAQTEVNGVKEDVAEIRSVVSEMRDEFRASKRWLATTAISFAGLAVVIGGAIARFG